MPWECRLREPPTTEERWSGAVAIGDMWFADWLIEDGQPAAPDYLSDQYTQNHMATRPPLMVRLPGGYDFCVDSRATDAGKNGWTVTGEPPKITVSPSINAIGVYHGWIRDGIITDDCEGRTY